MSRMSKLILLYSTLLVGLIFLIIPDWHTPHDFFLFSNMKLTGAMHIYFIGEKAILVVLAYIIVTEAKDYQNAIWVFFWLLVADLADYLLSYNSIWFSIGNFPVSMNIVKAFVFGGVIINEGWKHIKKYIY